MTTTELSFSDHLEKNYPKLDEYYTYKEWNSKTSSYSLNTDIWGTCYAPTVRARMQLGRALLRTRLQNASKVLDIGAGPALHSTSLLDYISDANAYLFIVENSLTALKLAVARRHPRIAQLRLIQADIAALPFPDAFMDAVICTEVLEHVVDDGAAVAELHRVLRPAGVAYFSVPLEKKPSTAWHLRCYEPEGLHKLLETAGFSVEISVVGGAVVPRLWRWVRHLIWAAWLLGTGNAVRQLRGLPVPPFYASRLCRNIVIPVFDQISKLDEWLSLKFRWRLGNTLHCIATKSQQQGSL
jgi:ubiquinone/menaquinone biosynthesis C-methylase UbiE